VDPLADHIMTFRCNSPWSILLRIYILSAIFIIYILGILSLRIRHMENIIDLKKIGKFLLNFYYTNPLSIILINIIIITLLLISVVWTIVYIKKYLLNKIMSLHFYFAEEGSFYQKKLADLGWNNYLYRYLDRIIGDIFANIGIYFFMKKYIKFFTFLYTIAKDSGYQSSNIMDDYYKKYGYICTFFTNTCHFILYNIHYLLLFVITLYDIIYNNMVLLSVAVYLPFMFIVIRMYNTLNFLRIKIYMV